MGALTESCVVGTAGLEVCSEEFGKNVVEMTDGVGRDGDGDTDKNDEVDEVDEADEDVGQVARSFLRSVGE